MRRLGLVFLILVWLSVIGFAEGQQEAEAAGGESGPNDYDMVLILPGPINDQSWNATNYSGLAAANEQLGTNIEYVESVQQSDFESTFRNYGSRGFDVVIAAGTQFDDAAVNVAPSYPETHYIIINGANSNDTNLTGVTIREWESGYLAGVLAGLSSETGIIGQIGGFPNPLMKDALNGVTKGARAVNADFGRAIRAYANSWSDVAKGKELATSMIDRNADVIFAYANQAGLGALQAAQEADDVNFIGFASNQNDIAPRIIPASVVYRYDQLYVFVVGKFLDETLEPGVLSVGLEEGIIDVVYSDTAIDEMRTEIDAAREGILSGDITKPPREE